MKEMGPVVSGDGGFVSANGVLLQKIVYIGFVRLLFLLSSPSLPSPESRLSLSLHISLPLLPSEKYVLVIC